MEKDNVEKTVDVRRKTDKGEAGAMEKKARKPWSDEARARKDFCIVWGLAREIGVGAKPLLKTLIATDKVTLHKMSEIEPREKRLRAFKNLVIDYCQGVTA